MESVKCTVCIVHCIAILTKFTFILHCTLQSVLPSWPSVRPNTWHVTMATGTLLSSSWLQHGHHQTPAKMQQDATEDHVFHWRLRERNGANIKLTHRDILLHAIWNHIVFSYHTFKITFEIRSCCVLIKEEFPGQNDSQCPGAQAGPFSPVAGPVPAVPTLLLSPFFPHPVFGQLASVWLCWSPWAL